MMSWLSQLFGRRPSLPIDEPTRQRLDGIIDRLVVDFGEARIRAALTITPGFSLLPADFDPSDTGITELLDRVNYSMGVDAGELDLRFYDDSAQSKGPESEQRTDQVWIHQDQRHDGAAVLATLAHEVADYLLAASVEDPAAYQRAGAEAEVLAALLGLGIFPANTAVHEANWTDGGWSGWAVGRRGVLSLAEHGYVLGRYALIRGEFKPDWADFLRLDVRDAMRRTIAVGRDGATDASGASGASGVRPLTP